VNAAVIITGITVVSALVASVALFVVEQPQAAWASLLVGLLGVLLLIGMVASTARADVDARRR
jgi:hypothetical protein